MDPSHVILRNFAFSDEYDESSFTGRLHENLDWHWDEYWLLEWALYELASSRSAHPELDWPVFKIFSGAFLEINCHFDPNDAFEINDVELLAAQEMRERFQLVFEGYFSNELPHQEECFDVQNPLIRAAG